MAVASSATVEFDVQSLTSADVAVATLARAGIRHVFGLPGTTIMEMLDALARQSDMRFVSVRHEQAAAHMADGYFRVSRRLAAAVVSRGPGAANLAIGVHNAHAESVPLLAIVGQVPDVVAYRDAFEEFDVMTFFAPMTKWRAEVHVPERIPELLARAIRLAQSGRPRPVLVSLPLDVQQAAAEPVEDVDAALPLPAVPAPAAVSTAAELLCAAERPLLVVGGGAARPWWPDEVIGLAEALAAPVATTWLRKGAFPNQHPLFVGTLGYGASPAAARAIAEADVLLALGCRFSEFTTQRWALPGTETRLVQVDVDADELGAVHPAEIGLVGDAIETASLLAQACRSPRRGATWATELRADYERAQGFELEPPGDSVGSGHVVAALQRVLDRHDALLFQDAHSFGPWVARHLEFTRPGAYWGAAGGAMGWGFPAALGAQLALPDRRIVAVCGDGSFWMVAQELETAVRERLPVVTVITNNFAYGNTRDRQRIAHDGRYLGVFYDNPDFAAFARLLGAHGERVERPEELEPALERALAAGVPAVVDVIQSKWEGLPPGLAPPVAK